MNVIFDATDGNMVDACTGKDGEPSITCMVSRDGGRTWSYQLSDNYLSEIKFHLQQKAVLGIDAGEGC